jgi:transcriptional regulator with XRE-family HTH domain
MLTASPQTPPLMAPIETSFYDQLGRRIAERRKALGITQVQLAQTLGIAQQTMAHYEGGKVRIAAAVLPVLADALDLDIEALIGVTPKRAQATPHKRGPAPKMQQQLEQLGRLPKAKQRMLLDMLEAAINSNSQAA